MYMTKGKIRLFFIITTTYLGMLSYYEGINQLLSYLIIVVFMVFSSMNILGSFSKSEFRKLISKQSLVLILLAVIIIVQLVNSIEGELTIFDAMKVVIFPVSFFYSCILAPAFLVKNNYVNAFYKCLLFPGICLSICTIIISLSTAFTYGSVNLTTLQTAQFNVVHPVIDSNYQGAIAAIACIICLFFIAVKKVNKLVYSFLFIVGLLNIVILASRASLLAILICTIISLFLYGSKKIRFLLLIIMIIVALMYSFIKNSIYQNSIIYDNIFDADRGSTGRIEIWIEILQKSSQKLFTGYGNNLIEIKSLGPHVNLVSSHNSFIDFLAINGVFSLLIYSVILFKGFIKSSSTVIENPSFLLIICILVIMNFTTHNLGGISYIPQILGILLGLIVLHKKPQNISRGNP